MSETLEQRAGLVIERARAHVANSAVGVIRSPGLAAVWLCTLQREQRQREQLHPSIYENAEPVAPLDTEPGNTLA